MHNDEVPIEDVGGAEASCARVNDMLDDEPMVDKESGKNLDGACAGLGVPRVAASTSNSGDSHVNTKTSQSVSEAEVRI